MKADNVHIRPALSQDIETMVQLLETLFAIEEDFQIDRKRQETGLTMLLNSGHAMILVAEYDRKVIGMCTGQCVISTAEGGKSLLVEDVVIFQDWQGRGIGSRLITALAEWAGQQGINRLQLLADRNNRSALSFYEKNGWQRTELICLRTFNNR